MDQKFAEISLENRIIMGVINLSPETFYKGSLAEGAEEARRRAERMVSEGAEIIDLGGMSTGPEIEPLSKKKERERLLPAVKAVRDRIKAPISVDTQRAEVADEALESGADIINDVSGFKADEKMPEVAAGHECSAILMANQISGRIRTAEKGKCDIEGMKDIKKTLRDSLQICRDHGIDLTQIAVDPAIGFGRERGRDLEIIAELEKLSELKQPICIGVSRKSFLGKALNLDKPSERLPASLGATAVAVMKGADIVRTHDPKETTHLVRMIEAIQEERGE